MKKLYTSILLVICLNSFAQSQYSLSFAPGTIITADTAEYNTLVPIEFHLINTGSDTIFSNITISYSVNADELGEWQLSAIYMLFTIVFDEEQPFAPNDSIYFNSDENELIVDAFFIQISEERNFSVGDNIIIVWPSLATENLDNVIFTSDHYIKEIYVPEPLSLYANDELVFSLFQDHQYLRIESSKPLENVHVYGVNGKLVYSGKENLISAAHLSTGLYVFHVQFEDGQVQTGRVFINNH